MSGDREQLVAQRVRAVVWEIAGRPTPVPDQLASHANLILDLGFDSLKLADLASELEMRLPLAEFPLQQFLDQQQDLGSGGFSLGALVETCLSLHGSE